MGQTPILLATFQHIIQFFHPDWSNICIFLKGLFKKHLAFDIGRL